MQQVDVRNRPGWVLVATAAISMIFALSGCKGDKGDPGVEGPPGPTGPVGAACTVVDGAAGKTITCPDGTTVTLSNGQDGEPGADGTSCTVTDNGDGTKTITCGATTVTVNDGATGANGENGQDGESCAIADNGDGTKTITCGNGTSVTVSDGSDGSDGADGASCTVTDNGDGTKTVSCEDGTSVTLTNGQNGQDGLNAVGGKLKLVIDGVSTAGTTATLTFTIFPAVAACPDGTCGNLSNLSQKTFYATEYDPATKTFTTARSFNFTGFTFKQLVKGAAGEQGAQYTATKANPSFTVEASQSAMVYGYIADATVLPNKGSYRFPDNVASASKVYGTLTWESAANVAGCETCHVAPYSKHGYRQGRVAGLPDMASCKACHTDQRSGGHIDWQILVDDPLTVATAGGVYTAEQKAKYAYVASTMNDTHMSHAMEFAYPQSMGNCVACHEGKLDMILADEQFTLKTCKSCHAVTGDPAYADSKRAPALLTVVPADGAHNAFRSDPYNFTGACNGCHSSTAGFAPTFAAIHPGFDKQVFSDETTRFADSVTTVIDSATYAEPSLTVTFHLSGAPTGAVLNPLVVMSLYGYDTKDFVVSGHSNAPAAAGGGRNLEASLTATCPRLTVTQDATDPTKFTAVADLTLWLPRVTEGSVKRVEIGVLPKVTVGTSPATYDVTASGVSKTFDLAANALVDDAQVAGKAIVDAGKCNVCHAALGTTFHSPSYGSAGAVGCRLCHTVNNGGGHLEMQSRSIDSYVHAIHSFQPFDPNNIDFDDPVESMRYDHHVESTYPNFSILNCESCHNPGTYDVPDQTRSLPGLFSAAKTNATWDRSIGAVPAYVAGPASRACGSCHRATMINEDAAGELASFNAHTAAFGTLATPGDQTKLDSVTATVMSYFGGPAPTSSDADARMESCSTCHPNAGAEHQTAFNRWKDGL